MLFSSVMSQRGSRSAAAKRQPFGLPRTATESLTAPKSYPCQTLLPFPSPPPFPPLPWPRRAVCWPFKRGPWAGGAGPGRRRRGGACSYFRPRDRKRGRRRGLRAGGAARGVRSGAGAGAGPEPAGPAATRLASVPRGCAAAAAAAAGAACVPRSAVRVPLCPRPCALRLPPGPGRRAGSCAFRGSAGGTGQGCWEGGVVSSRTGCGRSPVGELLVSVWCALRDGCGSGGSDRDAQTAFAFRSG